jgi:two-component system response regulator
VAILLVEDDAGDAERALHALREASPASEVHWVRNGAEALDFLFCSGVYAGRDPGDAPRLVLLDVKMPRIDGIEVVRRMKGSHLRVIPVVVMTSSSEERDVLQSYRLGVDAYLVKPVQVHALRAAVSHLDLAPGS